MVIITIALSVPARAGVIGYFAACAASSFFTGSFLRERDGSLPTS